MTVALATVLVALGFIGSFVSGALGLGGAIVMLPLLLYVPPLVGVEALNVKTIAGITMVQVVVASTAGLVAHHHHRSVSADLALVSGSAMAAGSLVGAVASRLMPSQAVLVVYALMVTSGAALLLVPAQSVDPEMLGGEVRYNRAAAAVGAAGVGLVAGIVGSGGAFLILPMLVVLLRVPLRVAIGSSLAIAALGSLFGFVGKLVTGQISFSLAAPVLVGAVVGAPVGASLSRHLSARTLRSTLVAVLLAAAVGVWFDLLLNQP